MESEGHRCGNLILKRSGFEQVLALIKLKDNYKFKKKMKKMNNPMPSH